eukprot:2347030-Amphidinium_carterae.1
MGRCALVDRLVSKFELRQQRCRGDVLKLKSEINGWNLGVLRHVGSTPNQRMEVGSSQTCGFDP